MTSWNRNSLMSNKADQTLIWSPNIEVRSFLFSAPQQIE